MYILHFVYSSIPWWTFVLLLHLSYYEWCCYKHGYTNNFSSRPVLGYFILIPSSGIAVAHCSSFLFLFFKNFQTVFHSSCTILHSHQQCQVFQFLHILTRTCFHFLLIVTIWTGMKWYLIVVLIYISLIISDGNHNFIRFLAICVPSSEKCLFFVHFLIGLFHFFVVSYRSSRY